MLALPPNPLPIDSFRGSLAASLCVRGLKTWCRSRVCAGFIVRCHGEFSLEGRQAVHSGRDGMARAAVEVQKHA